jgi:hypothetical protein
LVAAGFSLRNITDDKRNLQPKVASCSPLPVCVRTRTEALYQAGASGGKGSYQFKYTKLQFNGLLT